MVAISKDDQLGKKRPKRKKSKSAQKAIIKKLDKICSMAVLQMDRGRFWDNPPLQGFACNNHLVRRGQMKVRWNPLNVHCGSSGANYRHEQNNHYMVAWFIEKYGDKTYQELVKFSVGEAKWHISELEEMLVFWDKVYKEKLGRGITTAMYLTDFRSVDHKDLYNAWTRRL
jgi:hypothetical protein